MNRIHLIGGKNHGKTSLFEELMHELLSRNLTVGTIKFSSHHHEPEMCGKDSFRHRLAGASPAAFITPQLVSVFVSREDAWDPYRLLAPLYQHCQLVLVEGNIEEAAPKIEVWRAALGTTPLAVRHNDILAVVADDHLSVPLPIIPRSKVSQLADFIIQRFVLEFMREEPR